MTLSSLAITLCRNFSCNIPKHSSEKKCSNFLPGNTSYLATALKLRSSSGKLVTENFITIELLYFTDRILIWGHLDMRPHREEADFWSSTDSQVEGVYFWDLMAAILPPADRWSFLRRCSFSADKHAEDQGRWRRPPVLRAPKGGLARCLSLNFKEKETAQPPFFYPA